MDSITPTVFDDLIIHKEWCYKWYDNIFGCAPYYEFQERQLTLKSTSQTKVIKQWNTQNTSGFTTCATTNL